MVIGFLSNRDAEGGFWSVRFVDLEGNREPVVNRFSFGVRTDKFNQFAEPASTSRVCFECMLGVFWVHAGSPDGCVVGTSRIWFGCIPHVSVNSV